MSEGRSGPVAPPRSSNVSLLCTVRGCGKPLLREATRVVCPQGHSFDIARSGYINLLQPQDKRSKHPGDSAEAIAARRRLHDRGITAPLFEAISALVEARADDVFLDAGCGDGFYLGTLASHIGCEAHGVDISIPAVNAAARRYRECQWVAANADRCLPYPDGSFSAVMSITGRMNPPEFHRVLREDGRLLVAFPAPDDLIELRGVGRDRAERTVADFAGQFELRGQRRASSVAELDAAAVQDVLVSIYRPLQAKPPEATRLIFSLDLLLFKPRPL